MSGQTRMNMEKKPLLVNNVHVMGSTVLLVLYGIRRLYRILLRKRQDMTLIPSKVTEFVVVR